jgi:tRNA (guanine10-N2)-methyltransferase
MDFIVKFAQVHESFRMAELRALAVIEDVDLDIVGYSDEVGPASYFGHRKSPMIHPCIDAVTVSNLSRTTTLYTGCRKTDQKIHPRSIGA